MADAGILTGDIRVELLDGEIVMMSPIGPEQSAIIRRLAEFFIKHLPESIECSVQLPIAVGDHSEPEPDLAIVRRRSDDYRTGHPGPKDILVLIEVARTSLQRDRGLKKQLYAAAGIAEYWVVDVDHKTLFVYRQPSGLEYGTTQQLDASATIAPLAVPECPIDVGWLFR